MVRERIRLIRRRTAPLRKWLRRRQDPLRIQRTVLLHPDDLSPKRKRWHVLVDLLNEQVRGENLRVAEIGACTGQTSAHLLQYCPQIARIFAIDLDKPDPRYDCITHLEKVTFVQGSSDRCARQIPDDSLDLVFIDADHSEEWVLRDLNAWMPKVKPGGLIAGHDYGSHNHPGVKSAVDLFFDGRDHGIACEADKVWWTLR